MGTGARGCAGSQAAPLIPSHPRTLVPRQMLFKPKPPEFRKPVPRRVRDLEIASARLIRAEFAGDYHSAFHGRGIEFSQVRECAPGDDSARIDWTRPARQSPRYVKGFVEERDL